MLRYILEKYFKKEPKEIEITCKNCTKHGTFGCPNSSLCYSREDKPHFEPKTHTR